MCNGQGGLSFAGNGKPSPRYAPTGLPGNAQMPFATGGMGNPMMQQFLQQRWPGFRQMPMGNPMMLRQFLQQRWPGVQQFQHLGQGMAAGGAVRRKGRVTLTPEERALCRQLGLDEHVFARNKLRMLTERGE